jgi:radical SAM protein with 4Fe4S-binding SPASM domain
MSASPKEDDRPRFTAPWILRNDGDYVVAYTCTTEDLLYRVLSPVEAMLLPMLDGAHSLAEIREVFLSLWDEQASSHQAALASFDTAIASLNEMHGLLTQDGPASPSLDARTDLVPSIQNYKLPTLRLVRPLMITLGFTNRCGCDCVYCYAERESCDEHSVDDWRAVLDQISAEGIRIVDIGGSDIFSRRDAIDLLAELVNRKLTFFVSTKSRISLSTAEHLRELGIGDPDQPSWMQRPLQVSLDSASPEVAALMTGVSCYLQIATESISNLIAAGIIPRVKAVLTGWNWDAALELVRHFVPMGVNDFRFAQYNRGLYRHRDDLFLSSKQKHQIQHIEQQLRAEFPHVHLGFQQTLYAGGARNQDWETWRQRKYCSGGRTKMLIKPDGDVTLCEQPPHQAQFVVGNVFKQRVMDIWNGPRLLAAAFPSRAQFRETICFDCDEARDCFGRVGYCFRDSLLSYGTAFEAPPECPLQTRPALRNL